MAKRKTTAKIETLHREVLANGNIHLWSVNGIIDTRSNAVYSEVICKPKNERFYKEAVVEVA